MAAPIQQFAFNSNTGFSVVEKNEGEYKNLSLQSMDGEVKNFKYSPKGRYLIALTAKGLFVLNARSESLEVLHEFPIANVLDYAFSPKESYLMVLARYVKPAENDAAATKNLSIISLATGDIIYGFTQKSASEWTLEWTEDEAFCGKLMPSEIQFYNTSNFGAGVHSRIKLENIQSFSISPGKKASVALFVAGKNGAPSSSRIYEFGKFTAPVSQKSFFRADRVTFHWNNIGINVLVFTHTDVDATGQSYYGETSLYYLAVDGKFDCRVELNKTGPIHDVQWSPNAKEFIVVYGSMPAKSTLFDHRASPMYELGTGARNTAKYSPSGRFFFVAGFGNLAGELDVWERKSFKKISTIAASNSSTCEWSPDGRHIMAGILYRRLKVDNGVKIWHYSGTVAHQIECKEMYQVLWRPEDASLWPQHADTSPAPATIAPVTPVKTAGKYVPPGARNSMQPSQTLYDRDAIDRDMAGRNPKKGNTGGGGGGSGGGSNNNGNNTKSSAIPIVAPPATVTSGVVPGGILDHEKKVKGIEKKLKQIEDLKVKRATGAKLELTQISKIESEADLRKELAVLTFAD